MVSDATRRKRERDKKTGTLGKVGSLLGVPSKQDIKPLNQDIRDVSNINTITGDRVGKLGDVETTAFKDSKLGAKIGVAEDLFKPKDKTSTATDIPSAGEVSNQQNQDNFKLGTGETELLTDANGKVSGVKLSDGRVLFGLTPDKAQQFAAIDIQQRSVPVGSVTDKELAGQRQAAQRQAEFAQQIGQFPEGVGGGGVGGQVQQGGIFGGTPFDWNQVRQQFTNPESIQRMLVAGGIGGVGGATAGGKIGGIVGTAFAPGVGTAVGGVIGGILGGTAGVALAAWQVMDRNIKDQKTDRIAAQKRTLRDAKSYGNQLIMLANMDPEHSDRYIDSWNHLQYNAQESYTNLKLATQQNANLRLGLDGTRELQQYENYFGKGGGYEYQKFRLQQALASPNYEMGMTGLLLSNMEEGLE